jgi:predicted outer membrane repeat protein
VFGSCLPGAPLDCDDGNDCTVDYCDGRLGCLHLDETSGTACSDGDACTQGDACQAGACASGAEICDYAVTTTADSGPGSLRSHLDFGPVTPTGVVTIKIMVDGLLRLKSPLPLLRGEFVIDGEGRTFLIDGDGQHRAFASVGSLTLKNLKIQNAASTLTTGLGPGRGGAVYVNDTDEFDTDVPKLVVEDCTFYNNFAREAGGAIYAEKANVTVVRSLFSLNGRNEEAPTAPGGDPLQGGAVSIWSVPNSGVDATFDDVRFEYNMGPARGAALWCGWYTTCDVKRSSFYGNKAYQGVFASAYAAESTLTNVSFISNEGWDVGGAIFGDGTLSLTHVTVAANNSIDALKWPTVYVDGLTKIVNSVIAENGPNKKTLACLKGPNATLQVTSSTIAPRLTPVTSHAH